MAPKTCIKFQLNNCSRDVEYVMLHVYLNQFSKHTRVIILLNYRSDILHVNLAQKMSLSPTQKPTLTPTQVSTFG
ncbi:hypothetical protein DPMN_047537 [Dreissena polymorpha]|uniref:Uncharacterized protein n=1 Tax=Dreissena polymorpha TaxID=45954 RepID=A0A9D4DBL8_DREPO|nr:hypothetical protein DPMN_047537 [Dreissena polymorpha]